MVNSPVNVSDPSKAATINFNLPQRKLLFLSLLDQRLPESSRQEINYRENTSATKSMSTHSPSASQAAAAQSSSPSCPSAASPCSAAGRSSASPSGWSQPINQSQISIYNQSEDSATHPALKMMVQLGLVDIDHERIRVKWITELVNQH